MRGQANLWGIERQVFLGFDSEVSYLERVNYPDEEKALKEFAREMGVDPEDLRLRKIHMRYATGEEALEASYGVSEEAWLECEADHPDAVPFWKDPL